jgi:hypothetical protein
MVETPRRSVRLWFALGLVVSLLIGTPAGAQNAALATEKTCVKSPTRNCLLDLAQPLALGVKDRFRLQYLCDVAKAQARAGRLDRAEVLVAALLSENGAAEQSLTREDISFCVIETWGALGRHGEAKQLAQTIEGKHRRATALFAIAKALGRNVSADEAFQFVGAHEQDLFSRPSAIRRVAWDIRDAAVTRGEEGRMIDALRVVQSEETDRPRSFTMLEHSSEYVPAMLIIAEPLARRGRFEEAWRLAAEVIAVERVSAFLTVGGIQARTGDVAAFLRNVRSISDGDQRYQTLHFFFRGIASPNVAEEPSKEDMERSWGPPPESWGEYVNATAENLAEALVLARSFTEKRDRDVALAVVAMSHARRGDVAAAQYLTREIDEAEARHLILRAVGRAQAAAGLLAPSLASFNEAFAIADAFDPGTWDSRDVFLSSLVADMASAGLIDEALKVVKAMNGNMSHMSIGDDNVDSERRAALYFVAKAQAKAGRIAEALETARAVSQKWKLGLGVGVVAEGCAEAERFAETLEAARLADKPNEVLAEIAQTLAKSGKMGLALRLAESIDDRAQKARTLGVIGQAQARAGVNAAATWGAAAQAALSIGDDWARHSALLFLAQIASE